MTELRKVQKLYNIDLKSVDEEKRQITFCFSDNQPDRQGEIVDQESWDVKNYMQNPVILWGHDPSENENVLGQGISLDLNNGGKSFITAQFDDAETNPKADMIFRQLIKRTLRTVSAGFISHTFEWQDDTPVLKDNELLEVSVVAIPANPRAIARSFKDGSLSRKDAAWLLDSMKKESAELEKELAQPEVHHKEENVDELKTQVTALTEAMAKIAESVNTNNETVSALATQLSEMKTAADEAASKAAEEAQKAEDEAKAAADAEAAQKAEEEAQAAKDKEAEDVANKDDAAKGGENDQPGAVTDAFDPAAELTPELQAQLDAALEQTLTPTEA